MSAYRISDPAKADLEDIWDYLAARNYSAADACLNSIREAISRAAVFTGMGSPAHELKGNMRMLVEGNYLIFYMEHPTHIEVMRVLHSSRDIKASYFG